jgi:hypothetical protein
MICFFAQTGKWKFTSHGGFCGRMDTNPSWVRLKVRARIVIRRLHKKGWRDRDRPVIPRPQVNINAIVPLGHIQEGHYNQPHDARADYEFEADYALNLYSSVQEFVF